MDKRDKPMLPSSKSVLLPLVFIAVVVILIVLTFFGIAGINPLAWLTGAPQEYSYSHLMMDTAVELVLYTDKGKATADEVAQKTFEEMERFEAMFDRGVEGSEVWNINDNAGQNPVKINDYTMGLIEDSLYYGEITEGGFDITIAPLMDTWGFYDRESRLPSDAEIGEVLPLVDYRLLEVDAEAGEVFLPEAGMTLDLGGIAKGYIVDIGIEVLKQEGIESAFMNAGGDIRVMDGKPDGDPWWIGVPNPRSDGYQNELKARIPLENSAIVTSGDYERYFEEDGRLYHHIIDPDSGYPAEELASVTIIAPETDDADALSTAVFVMGPQKGMELVENLPGVEAVLITPDLDILYSTGLGDVIELR